MQALRTKEGFPYAVEIPGAGLCPSFGTGGVSLERAAKALPELQDEGGKPLSGSTLTQAAKAFAADRGLEVVTVSASELGELELRPPLAEVARGSATPDPEHPEEEEGS